MDRHVPLQLSAVGEAVAALGAVEALLRLLVSVLDVLLQGAVTLVASCAVRAGEQLRERIGSSCVEKKDKCCKDIYQSEGEGRKGGCCTHSINRQRLFDVTQGLPQ